VVQPVLDPLFDERSFGYRPKRSHLQALAMAERLFLHQKRRVWVTVDLRDAFLRVPRPRLLDVVRKYIVADDPVRFIGRLLAGASTPGLRQGGPLSPLLLNRYLHHHLDRKWRAEHPDVPLIRYANDILLLCRSRQEAGQAYEDLMKLLEPTGMTVKEERADAVRMLTPESPAGWMGFHITREKGRLRFGLAEGALSGLEERLVLAHEEPDAPVRAVQAICGWVGHKGPCYESVSVRNVYERIASLARKQAFDEIPGEEEFKGLCQRAWARWRKLRVGVAKQLSGQA
jgi:hypothetical protein